MGKTKTISEIDENRVFAIFKNSVTGFNASRKGEIEGKGAICNAISALLMEFVSKQGINTHWIGFKEGSDNSQELIKLSMIPLEFVVRYKCAGSYLKRNQGSSLGDLLSSPLVELFEKTDQDPIISAEDAINSGVISESELEHISKVTLQVGDLIKGILDKCNLSLVDMKLEFGRDKNNNILLGDELSPDNMRVWDKKGDSYDKDLFRNAEDPDKSLKLLRDKYLYLLNTLSIALKDHLNYGTIELCDNIYKSLKE